MENPIIVPFDLNTARKIKSGEIEGSVLIGNIKIEFVYESKDCADRYNLLMDIVSKYTALLGQQKLKESFVKDLELVLSRKNPNIEKGKLNFIRYSEMKNWSVRELFGEDLEQADRALINKVYHMLFDIGSDFESVIRMLYSFRNGPKSGIKVADPEDNYEWTNKDGNEKYSTKNLPKAHFRWDWRRYTLSKESVDKITEFVDTILES